MGVFTWTDAQIETPRKSRGEYCRKDVLEYGEFGKVVCPDDTEYCTECYGGYGIFGSKDAYDLVAEWNREELSEGMLREESKRENFGGLWSYEKDKLREEGVTEEEIKRADEEAQTEHYEAYLKRRQNSINRLNDYREGKLSNEEMEEKYGKHWKREIGIDIACYDEQNAALKYPLKITATKEKVRYEDLYPSRSTQ